MTVVTVQSPVASTRYCPTARKGCSPPRYFHGFPPPPTLIRSSGPGLASLASPGTRCSPGSCSSVLSRSGWSLAVSGGGGRRSAGPGPRTLSGGGGGAAAGSWLDRPAQLGLQLGAVSRGGTRHPKLHPTMHQQRKMNYQLLNNPQYSRQLIY